MVECPELAKVLLLADAVALVDIKGRRIIQVDGLQALSRNVTVVIGPGLGQGGGYIDNKNLYCL